MLKIRKTKKQDLKELARIYRDAYKRSKFGEEWTMKEASALVNFLFNQKTLIGITALFDGKIVGAFLSFIRPWHHGNRLGEGELFIDPKYQGKKIGTKLFFEMMEIAKKRKCFIHQLVAYGDIARWYKKLGMEYSYLKYMEGNIESLLKNKEKFL